jgi:hypothetical protein
VDVAKRGWLGKEDVFNTGSATAVTQVLASRKP